jgi:hypothetical protein
MRYHASTRMAITQRTDHIKWWLFGGDTRTSCTAGGNGKWCSPFGEQSTIS